MSWVVLVLLFGVFCAIAGVWGYLHDPKHGGVVGCCGCGQCLATGECVMVKRMQEKGGKRPPAA